MTDKVQKIREEVERLENLHHIKYQNLDTNDNMCLVECGKRNLCSELLSFIDSLQEEPVSEGLEEAASSFARKDSKGISNPANFYYTVADKARIFKAGAKWQRKKDLKKE